MGLPHLWCGQVTVRKRNIIQNTFSLRALYQVARSSCLQPLLFKGKCTNHLNPVHDSNADLSGERRNDAEGKTYNVLHDVVQM